MKTTKRTSAEWWETTKNDPSKLIDWLKDQYHGEATAANRIRDHITSYVLEQDKGTKLLLDFVADQENQHAEWVGELLKSRGITPELLDKQERYWEAVGIADSTGPANQVLERNCAIAAYAEEMRLERIRVIASDNTCPEDIRFTFGKILLDETGHAAIFNKLAKDKKDSVAENHARGLEALGLII